MKDSRLRIVVTGMVGLYPVGGVAWDYLQYAVGLHRLGHDVWYHEDTWAWPYDPEGRTYTDDGAGSANFLHHWFQRHEPALADRWHYQHLHDTHYGMTESEFDAVVESADLFLNVSGASTVPSGLSSQCVTAFVDTDPGYNQIVYLERPDWSPNVDRWCALVDAHDVHLTYAENIHDADCGVPTAGFDWRTTRMPVVADLWPQPPARAGDPWTTVMTWNAFGGPVVHAGREYGSKDREFERLLDLPSLAEVPLLVALGGVDPPADRLLASGWEVADGPELTRDAAAYQDFLAGSRGEVSAAKHIYVALRTGWFSTRSACYLATGRPVVVQDTGFPPTLPVGDGILAFTTAAEAAEAIAAVESDYARHCVAAREVAADHFGAARVLNELLESVFSSGHPAANTSA